MLHGNALAENFGTKQQVEQIRYFLTLKSNEKFLKTATAPRQPTKTVSAVH
jgi:hypothetical protein